MDRRPYLEGAWDIHVHASPSLFPRWGDIVDLAEICSSHAMSGVVVKFHHGSSVEAAQAVDRIYGNIKIYGGITLNYPVGGINPHAVDTALTLGAKIIWLPTIHAANHESAFGVLGGFHFQKSNLSLKPDKGITILDANGEIIDSLKTILDLIANSKAILATGHISREEIYKLKEHVKSEKLKLPLLVNHAIFKAPNLDKDDILELSDNSTWFETVYLNAANITGDTSVDRIASIIKNTPHSRWIIASDSGQEGKIKSPFAISEYAGILKKKGINEMRIIKMLKDEPAELLGH